MIDKDPSQIPSPSQWSLEGGSVTCMSSAAISGIGVGGRGEADAVGGASGKWCRVWAGRSVAGGVCEGCDLAHVTQPLWASVSPSVK